MDTTVGLDSGMVSKTFSFIFLSFSLKGHLRNDVFCTTYD